MNGLAYYGKQQRHDFLFRMFTAPDFLIFPYSANFGLHAAKENSNLSLFGLTVSCLLDAYPRIQVAYAESNFD